MAGAARDRDIGDDGLIEQARAGSGAAFEELWRRHAPAGRRVAARFTRSSEPDDLVQEAYLRIYSAMQNGNGPDLVFRPYLYQTIRNIAITWAARPVEHSITALHDVSDGSDMSETVLENSVTATAFRSLPGRWQSVLWYSEVEGLEPAEIAPLLGITPSAVSALAYRAREGLRRAWLQGHVNSEAVPPECTWAAERMGDFNRGALRGATKARFGEHVQGCARCMVLVEEVGEVSRKLGLVMVPIVVGVPWGAFTEETETAATTDAALTHPANSDVDGAASAARSRTKQTWTLPVAVGSVALALVVMVGAVTLNAGWTGAGTTVTSSAVVPAPAPAPAPDSAPSPDLGPVAEPVGSAELASSARPTALALFPRMIGLTPLSWTSTVAPQAVPDLTPAPAPALAPDLAPAPVPGAQPTAVIEPSPSRLQDR